MSYCVHAHDDEVARPHRVEAKSFLDAALAYAERWLPAEPPGGEPIRLEVEDEETGETHCLTLDLRSGEARACG